jgi:hypothetical protein
VAGNGIFQASPDGLHPALQLNNIPWSWAAFSRELLSFGIVIGAYRKLCTSRRELDTQFKECLCSKAFLFPKEAKQQMLSTDSPIGNEVCFFSRITQDALGFGTEWSFHRAWNSRTLPSDLLDFLPDCLRSPRRTKEAFR